MAIANVSNLKARQVKSHAFSETTAAAAEATLNTWLAGRTEQVIIDIQFQVYTSLFAVLILYTE